MLKGTFKVSFMHALSLYQNRREKEIDILSADRRVRSMPSGAPKTARFPRHGSIEAHTLVVDAGIFHGNRPADSSAAYPKRAGFFCCGQFGNGLIPVNRGLQAKFSTL